MAGRRREDDLHDRGHAMKRQAPLINRNSTSARQAVFLEAISCNCTVTRAARLADIDRTTHYEWLARDAQYKAAFRIATQMARGAVFDAIVHRALNPVFKPFIYRGRYCYAERKRVVCELADGTTAFEDELPEGARVIQRRTVTTQDGEQLGVYKYDERALWAALRGWHKIHGGPPFV
jgi:hypothetical protein